MNRHDDNIKTAFLNEANRSGMNTRISCRELELWEQTQSSSTMDSTMRGGFASEIYVEQRVPHTQKTGISYFLHYIKDKTLNFLGEKR